jgi:hypothetical protein
MSWPSVESKETSSVEDCRDLDNVISQAIDDPVVTVDDLSDGSCDSCKVLWPIRTGNQPLPGASGHFGLSFLRSVWTSALGRDRRHGRAAYPVVAGFKGSEPGHGVNIRPPGSAPQPTIQQARVEVIVVLTSRWPGSSWTVRVS